MILQPKVEFQTENILRSMIENNKMLQMLHQKNKESMSREHYQKEFQTIKFNIGRQVGTTTAIKKIMKSNDVVVHIPQMEIFYRGVRSVSCMNCSKLYDDLTNGGYKVFIDYIPESKNKLEIIDRIYDQFPNADMYIITH